MKISVTFKRSLGVAVAGLVGVLLLASDVRAQGDNTNTGTGTTTQSSTGGTAGRFTGAEVDMSAFEGIERSDTIGTSTTQGFGVVGESTASGGAARGAAGGGGGLGGGLGGLGGLFGALGGAFGGQGAATTKPTIRVRLRSAIELPPRPEGMLEQSAQQVLAVAPPRSGVQGVNVTMDGNTAILTGVVAREKDRRMSELLIRLEPGVRSVENRVEVRD